MKIVYGEQPKDINANILQKKSSLYKNLSIYQLLTKVAAIRYQPNRNRNEAIRTKAAINRLLNSSNFT